MSGGVLDFKNPLGFEQFSAAVGLVGMALECPDDIKAMLVEHTADGLMDAFQQVLRFQEAALLGNGTLTEYLRQAKLHNDAIGRFTPDEVETLRRAVVADFMGYMAKRQVSDLPTSIQAYKALIGFKDNDSNDVVAN